MQTDDEDGCHTDGSGCCEGDHPPQPMTSDINEILQAYMAKVEQQIEQAKRTLAVEVLPALLACGVANVEIAYSGYGDSGAIDGVQYRDVAGERVDRTTIPQPLVEQLENCVYEFLPSGFEINDGGQGTVLIDTQAAKVTIRHQENYTETRDSNREFDL